MSGVIVVWAERTTGVENGEVRVDGAERVEHKTGVRAGIPLLLCASFHRGRGGGDCDIAWFLLVLSAAACPAPRFADARHAPFASSRVNQRRRAGGAARKRERSIARRDCAGFALSIYPG